MQEHSEPSDDLLFDAESPDVVAAHSAASPERIWALLADPDAWPQWAPHLRAVDDPRATRGPLREPGARLVVRGPGGTRLLATVTRVLPGERWDFRAPLPVGQVLDSAHAVIGIPDGSRVATRLRIDSPIAIPGRVALELYRPMARLAMARLARLASSEDPSLV